MFEGAVAHDVTAHGKRVRVYEAGSGPPLLFLHDVFSDAETWADVAPELARTRRVVTIDLPGFGESEQPPEARFSYEIDAFADVVLDVAASRGAPRFSLVGHGFGGAVALHIAARHADLVESLVLVSPLVYETQRGLAKIGSLPILGSIFLKQVVGQRLFRRHQRAFMQRMDGPDREERHEARFARFSRPSARSSTAATLRNARDVRPNVASVPLVRARTLVVWGADDRISPLDHGRRVVRELSGARFDVMDAGHTPQEEVPETFVNTVQTFLEDGAKRPTASSRPPGSRRRR